MARSSSSARSGRQRWLRRTFRLAAFGTLVAAIGLIRARMLDADQRQFDQRYPASG
jgi:hypothetical protein